MLLLQSTWRRHKLSKMSNIEFNDSELQFLYDKSSQVSEVFAQSMHDWHSVQSEASKEFTKAQSEISLEISFIASQLDRACRIKCLIEKRIDEANLQIRPVPEMPPAPSVSVKANPQERADIMQKYADEKAKAEQNIKNIERENAKQREVITKLESSKKQLEGSIFVLEHSLQRLYSVKSELASSKSTFDVQCAISERGFGKSTSDICLFCNALNETCSCANAVFHVKSNFGYGDTALSRCFKINSAGFTSSRNETLSFKSGATNHMLDDVATTAKDDNRRVIIVKEKRREEVFKCLEIESDSHVTLKIAAANLHSLGGQQFIDEMEARMFTLVKKDGNIISNDGFIVWEK